MPPRTECTSLDLNVSYHFQGEATCKPCPAGKECVTDPDNPTDCTSGYYSLAGDMNCIICPSGSKCPIVTQGPSPCGDGTSTDGNTGQTTCDQCPAGFYCSDPA